jgi:hypothetical protein
MTGQRKDGDYKRTAYIGINKTGKSSRMLEVLQDSYHFSAENKIWPRDNRILILTRTTPDAYKNIKRLTTYEELKEFGHGIALFWDFQANAKVMLQNLVNIIGEGMHNGKKWLQNGAIVFEDCANYLEHNPPQAVKVFLEDHRMQHLDLFFTVHSFLDLSAFLRRRIMFVRIFKTLDVVSEKDLGNLRYPNYANIYQAWVKVMNDESNYANITIKTS